MKRPGIFLTAEWRYLAMLNYQIEPAILRPLVPVGTQLDAWNGKTLASIVGFLFLGTRLFGVPVPFHQNFEEVNLRFYVRRRTETGWKRGVAFVKEIVPRRAIAAVARLLYNENYAAMPMQHRIDEDGRSLRKNGSVEYRWRHQSWNRLQVKTTGEAQPLVSGSEEEFITEHYWGYASQPDGSSIEYQVEHPSWPVWQVRESILDCDVATLYGAEFVESLASKCSSAFLAAGSEIVVRRGQRVL